jgi:hypothetical protein
LQKISNRLINKISTGTAIDLAFRNIFANEFSKKFAGKVLLGTAWEYSFIWLAALTTNVMQSASTCLLTAEAEFLVVIGTKVLSVFLLAIHSQLY